MQRVPRQKACVFTLKKAPPLIEVEPGERFVVETQDTYSGRLQSENNLPTPDNLGPPYHHNEPPGGNPLAGPVYVRGAKRGDLLVVNIERITPVGDGVTTIRHKRGPLGDSRRWPECAGPYTRIIKHLKGSSGTLTDGVAVYNEKIKWRLMPFIGTAGVVPDIEASTLVDQGPWGGNLDCRDFKEGSKLYLNCYQEGGLLHVGDVHASQGDGEWTGVANEVKAELILSCSVIKKKNIPYLRIEKPDSIVSLSNGRPLEDAVNSAIVNLIEWLVTEHGWSPREAYMLVSVSPHFKINIYQMVKIGRLQYTVGAEIPKTYLR